MSNRGYSHLKPELQRVSSATTKVRRLGYFVLFSLFLKENPLPALVLQQRILNEKTKKKAIQYTRYKQDEEQAKFKETKDLTLDQLCSMIKPYEKVYKIDGKIDARRIRYAFREKLGIKIGYNKSYEIKTTLEMREEEEDTHEI